MQIIPATPANAFDTLEPGVHKILKVKTPALEVIELHVDPGHALKSHDMPSKVVFYLLEGEGVFTYTDQKSTNSEHISHHVVGEMIHIDPGIPRFWANQSKTLLKLLVIKSLTETEPA